MHLVLGRKMCTIIVMPTFMEGVASAKNCHSRAVVLAATVASGFRSGPLNPISKGQLAQAFCRRGPASPGRLGRGSH